MNEPEENPESFEEMESTRRKAIHAVLSFVMGLAVLGVLAGVVIVMAATKPKALKEDPKQLLPVVDVWEVDRKARQAEIVSQGVVESVREVTLSAEVTGKVVAMSEKLLRGSRVEDGEVLVEIEQADYLAGLALAEANLADARLLLEQEEARKEQALRDFEKLGRGKPSDLLLRIPQVKSAEARVDSALAEVARASRNVDRTRIAAPFAGTVRTEAVELGAVLAPGSMVAMIYSTEDLEVRLPLTLEDFGYLGREDDGSVSGEVTLTGRIGAERYEWPGRVVRVDGEVNRETLSATIVVKVGEAVEAPSYLRLPPVGLFVEAVVPGRELESLAKIPRKALRNGREIMVVGEDDFVDLKDVTVVRSDRNFVYVSDGVEDGDRVIETRIGGAAANIKVQVRNRRSENSEVVAEERS